MFFPYYNFLFPERTFLLEKLTIYMEKAKEYEKVEINTNYCKILERMQQLSLAGESGSSGRPKTATHPGLLGKVKQPRWRFQEENEENEGYLSKGAHLQEYSIDGSGRKEKQNRGWGLHTAKTL